MNISKLLQAEKEFSLRYPKGSEDPAMVELMRKHKMDKMNEMAHELFAKDKFDDPDEIVKSIYTIISKSSLISLFDKPKFRDASKSMSQEDKIELLDALKKRLYSKSESKIAEGFNKMVEVLSRYKLASWPIITIVPCYMDGQRDVCLKPNTVKEIISHYELEGLIYKSRPDYKFYSEYRNALLEMKSKTNALKDVDLTAFSGLIHFTIS